MIQILPQIIIKKNKLIFSNKIKKKINFGIKRLIKNKKL
jgi:hypothetical protein